MGNDTADWGNAATRLDWANTAISLNNLSEAELLSGEVTAAAASAERSVAYADRSGSEFEIVRMRATYADVLHAAGQHEKAERLFADAEDRQKKWQPMHPLLYSVGGYQYCDLLVARREWAAATGRASQTPEYVRRENWLLDIALDALTLGRAHLGMALDGASQRLADPARNDARAAGTMLGEAVDGLRSASHLQFVPRGLLARAAFRCSVGDWNSAARDLDEVEEVAEPGPMRLFLCDMALERARLAFARMEAFAPLNGLTDDSPSKPKPPTEAERQSLHTEAAKQLAIAAEYITTCGYHRRDEELAELEAVLAGQRRFADLPPRV